MANPRTAEGTIIVAHPGVQHSYETALAVQDAGLLRSYMTGLYFKPRGALGLAYRFSTSARRRLVGRRKSGLEDDLVRQHPLAELSYLGAVRVRPLARYARRMVRWRNRWFERRIARAVERQRPDAIICYDTCALRAFTAAGKLGILRVLDQTIGHWRTLAQLMNEEAWLSPDFADSLPLDLPQRFLAERSAEARMADLVMVGSQYARDTMVRHGVPPSRIAIVPYGADLARFAPARRADDGRFRVLFVGQLSQRKGIKYLLEAVRQLAVSNLELVLAGGVVGSGAGLVPYRDCFTHVGNVPHGELPRYFQSADVFVYPSLHEGSALAIYEALASGLPVITTANSGSVVRDGVEGFIVPIRDVEALQEKILLLRGSRRLREEMGANARKRACDFSWAGYRTRVGDLLTALLARDRDGDGYSEHSVRMSAAAFSAN